MIKSIPTVLYLEYRNYLNFAQNKCYENCGSMVLFQYGDNDFSQYCRENNYRIIYCLGFMKDCFGATHPHAWIRVDHNGESIYCDPTLQFTSSTWNFKRTQFHYSIVREMTAQEIKDFFLLNYPDREINDYGIPLGLCQFPILSSDGKVLCAKDLKQGNLK